MKIRGFRLRRADERGVTAVVVSLLVAVVLPVSAAFAVDIGQQRVVQRDMQAIADVGALDVSRQLADKRVDASGYKNTLTNALKASVARNKTNLGDAIPDTAIGSCFDSSGNDGAGTVNLASSSIPAGACWEFLDEDDNVTWASAAMPTKVRVRAKSEAGFAFSGVTGVAAGGGIRSAVAEVPDKTMCFELGSFAAALNLGSSVLGPMADLLGLDTELTLASYQSLAAVNLSLLDLVEANPSIGSPDALLDPSGISVGTLIDATIAALQYNQDNGSADTAAAISVLNGLLNPGLGLALDAMVAISDVVSVDAGDKASLATDLNVLDLIGTSLAVANGDNLADLAVPINLSAIGLGTASVKVTAIQGTQRACGRADDNPDDPCGKANEEVPDPATINGRGGACATQSQVGFELSLPKTDIPLIPGLNIPGLVSVDSDLSVGPVTLTGGVGNAKGVITSIDQCGPPDQLTVNARAGLLGVDLGVGLHFGLKLSIGLDALGPLQSLVGNVLNLPGLLGGILLGKQYEYRNYAISLEIADVGTTLTTSSAATTNTSDPELESPTNDQDGGVPVRVPDPPVAPQLAPLQLPTDLLDGSVTVRLTYEWRVRNAALGLIPAGAWGPGPNMPPRPALTLPGFGPNDGWMSNTVQAPPGSGTGPLLHGDLEDLGNSDGILGTIGGAVQGTLTGVLNALNNPVTGVVGIVNTTLNSTLLPLLGLSGSGADLYSVTRPEGMTCGGTPKLVG